MADTPYLLDTDVLSDVEKVRPCGPLMAWLDTVPAHQFRISVSSFFEIEYGIATQRVAQPEWARRKSRWLDLLANSGVQILPVTVEIMRLRAIMAATPELQRFFMARRAPKRPRFGEDILLAATAIVEGAAIVTFNERDFAQIGLKFALPGIVNPRNWASVDDDRAACRNTTFSEARFPEFLN